MKTLHFTCFLLLLIWFDHRALSAELTGPSGAEVEKQVQSWVTEAYPSLEAQYKHFHRHPELSLHEEQTSTRLATEMEQLGFTVTRRVGGFGIVAVLTNGPGPTILVRTDMDALPVTEQTGAPYASNATAMDDKGNTVGVMHACGHDMHMTVFVGTARVLRQIKDRWHGTLVMIGQPAEERVKGARAMLADGLFTRFPKPDYCIALHCAADLPTGSVGATEGYALANVDSVDIVIRGVGGHGAWPHKTKDPVVLAAQTVLALQTIVSRETEPTEPAVVTVGSIHGGTKYNIIPDEVRLQLTLRSYSDEVRNHTDRCGQAHHSGIGASRGRAGGPVSHRHHRGRISLGDLQRSGVDAAAGQDIPGLVRRKTNDEDEADHGRGGLWPLQPDPREDSKLHVLVGNCRSRPLH